MANIVVKKADGTTDITFTALTPSAGDNVAAQWRSESASSQNNGKPLATLVSKWNGDRTARRLNFEFRYPQTATSTVDSLTKVVNFVPVSFSIAVPSGCPDTIVAEAVAQATNLLVSTLVRSSLNTGFAPT